MSLRFTQRPGERFLALYPSGALYAVRLGWMNQGNASYRIVEAQDATKRPPIDGPIPGRFLLADYVDRRLGSETTVDYRVGVGNKLRLEVTADPNIVVEREARWNQYFAGDLGSVDELLELSEDELALTHPEALKIRQVMASYRLNGRS